MFILGNFFEAMAVVFDFVLTAYFWVVIAGAVLSWVNPDPYNPIVRFINNVTEPVFYQIRRRLPVNIGGLDLSPVVVILVIKFLQIFVVNNLFQMAHRIS